MFSVELRCADLELPSINDDGGGNWLDCDAKTCSVNFFPYLNFAICNLVNICIPLSSRHCSLNPMTLKVILYLQTLSQVTRINNFRRASSFQG